MFVDACALVAILSKEPEALSYEAEIARSQSPWTTPLAAFEAILVLARPSKLDAGYLTVHELLMRYLAKVGVALREPGDAQEMLSYAVMVADRHGTGKKKLSTFDCFHYAAAKTAGSPLLTLDNLLRDTNVPTLP